MIAGTTAHSSMSDTIKLAEYLFTRVKQLGADALHGVPGMTTFC